MTQMSWRERGRALGVALLAGGMVACGPRILADGGTDMGPGADGGGTDAVPGMCNGVAPVPGTPALTVELVANGLVLPTIITHAPGDETRLFIGEQDGRIRVVENGSLLPTPFLDITGMVAGPGFAGGETGLLGLAFHPAYQTNGRFFVHYSAAGGGDTVIAEYAVSGDPSVANAGSASILLTQSQPFGNHNGGQLAFGPDGYLYIGLGDGGSADDPQGNGQNTNTLLATILRIDVDSGAPYGIPPDNPFVGGGGAPEIFSYGLRNPWRFSFDRLNGDLYIGDVGQNAWEEIDIALASGGGGLGTNWGWNDCEGNSPFAGGCGGSEPPAVVYSHGEGCSVTGGFVYRGCRMPGHHGRYFYADYCSAFVRSFVLSAAAVTDEMDHSAGFGPVSDVSTFGEDALGELYIADLGGEVYRIVPQ